MEEEIYNPPPEVDHDETHEMYNLAADEQASKEMSEFLETLEKDNLGDVIKTALQKKLEFATSKLSELFKKQAELAAEEEMDILELQKEATLATATAQIEEKTNKKQDNMKQLMLQKKVTALNNQVELSEQKARSVTVQWAMDREKFKGDIKQKQREIHELQTRLSVMERKARHGEQVARDSNMVDEGPVDLAELERIKEELHEAHQDLAEKQKRLLQMSKDLNETKTELSSSEMKVELLTNRVEELVKAADVMHDAHESREKEESNIAKLYKASAAENAELVKEVKREQAAIKELEDELSSQKADFEQQIATLNVANLLERVKTLETELHEQSSKAKEREREMKRAADHSRIEKEQMARENKHLTLAINKVAYMSKTITSEFDTHKDAMDSRLDSELKKSQHMYAEIKALSKSIDNIAGDAGKRARELEIKMDEQKRAADAAEAEFEAERERLEMRALDMQKEMHAKEKNIKSKITAATQAEVAAKEAAQKELGMANLVIDRLNEKIEGLQRRVANSGSSAAAEKYLTDLEAEKDQFGAKMDAKEASILQLKKELAEAAAAKAALSQEIESERDRYDELRTDMKHVQEELEMREQQVATTSKNINLPQSGDASAQRELNKIREELLATKKDLAAKAKEIKTLQKTVEKAEKSEKVVEKKPAAKKEEPRPSVSSKGKRPPKAKAVATDSDSDNEAPAAPPAAELASPLLTASRSNDPDSDSYHAYIEQQLAEKERMRAELMNELNSIKSSGKAAFSQTDASIATATIDKKRVEAILREAILTDNYYFSKQTSSFTNVYPVEEHLMEDLVDSFHALSQDMLTVLRGVTGHGMSLKDSSLQEEVTAKHVVSNLEGMILKAGKDLVINLEKSKERNFKKLVAEQRGKLESIAGAADADIADAKEEVVQQMTEAFQKQLQDILEDKAIIEARLEETQDLLAVERARVIEVTESAAQMTKKKHVGFKNIDGGSAPHSDSEELGDLGEEEDEGPEIQNAEREVTDAEAQLLEIATAAGVDEDVLTDGKSLPESKAGVTNQFKAVALAKKKLMQLRKERNERKQQKSPEGADRRIDSKPGSPTMGSPKIDSPGAAGTSIRRKAPQNSKFDELDTGASILRRLTTQQTDDLKSLVLVELNEEVKQNLIEQERAQKEKAAKEDHHHVTRDVEALKEDLLQGKLQNIGEVCVSDFDRLRNKLFGTDDLISLTIVEHHIRFGGASDMYDIQLEGKAAALSKEEEKKQSLKRRQYRMLIRSMVLQRELLMKTITSTIPLLELMRYKHSTEAALAQLAVLSAWRALNYYRGGGVFRDVLEVHLEVIDKCIASAGGWQAALAQIENAAEAPLEVDTAHWPEFFRVRVLELLRTRYAEELDRTRVKLNTASLLFTQLRPVEFIQNNEVLPFDQILETEANRRRLDSMRSAASSKAEHLLDDSQFRKLNTSVKKLSAAAALSFQRYSSRRGDFTGDDGDFGAGTPPSGTPTPLHSRVIHAGDDDSAAGFGGQSSKSTGSYGFESATGEGDGDSYNNSINNTADRMVSELTMTMGTISENDGADVHGSERASDRAGAVASAVAAAVGSIKAAGVGIADARSPAAVPASAGTANPTVLIPTPAKSIANNPLLAGKSTAPSAAGKGVSPKGKVEIVREEKTDASWLQDEEDAKSFNDSVASSQVEPPAPVYKNSPHQSTPKTPAKGAVKQVKGKSGTPAGANNVHFGADTKGGGMSGDLLSELGGAFDAQENRAGSPSGNDSVVSNLSSNTGATPAPVIKTPALTKAAAARQAALNAKNALKFNRHDAVKAEEKKRKAAKAAEKTAADQKAAGESTAKLASAIGDMFACSDEEAELTSSDAAGSRSTSPVQHNASQVHHHGHPTHPHAGKIGSPTSRGLHRVLPEDVGWMHIAADKVVMSALYGDEKASQLIHCMVDGIRHWEGGQAGTAIVVLKAAVHMNLVPELVADFVQRAEKRTAVVPPIVIEIRDKFANIMAYIAKLAQAHEEREQYLTDHVLGSQIASLQLHHNTAAPYLPVHNAYPTGSPTYVLDTDDTASSTITSVAAPMRGSTVHPAHMQIHPHRVSPTLPMELHVASMHVPTSTHSDTHAAGHHNTGHHPHEHAGHLTSDAAQHFAPVHASGHHAPHPSHHHPVAHHHVGPDPSANAAHGAEFLSYNPVLQGPVVVSAHPVDVYHAPATLHPHPHAHPRHVPMEHAYDAHASTHPNAGGHTRGDHHQVHHQAHHGHHATVAHQQHHASQRLASPPHSGPNVAHPVLTSSDGSAGQEKRRPGPAAHVAHALLTAASAETEEGFRTIETPPEKHTLHRRTSIGAITYNAPVAGLHPGLQRFLNNGGHAAAPHATTSKPGTSAPRKKVAMFDNSTQTAHGSIQLHDMSSAHDESENVISSLVKTLLLDGWDRKVKKMVAKKKNLEPHTIITSANAVPTIFATALPDPFANTHTTTVFKGFEHAYFDEAEFEVLPGVRLASAHRVAAALRAHAKAERDKQHKSVSMKMSSTKSQKPGASTSSADVSHEDDIHVGSWIMKTNLRYCIRTEGADIGKRLKKAPFYIKAPVIPGCEAFVFPNVFPVKQGVNLITGEQCALGGNLALPEDVLMLQVAEDTKFPHGLTRVELSPVIKLSSSLQHYMQRGHPLPAGHHLVQITKPSTVALPEGVEVTSGVTIAATPPEFDLPSNIIMVKNPLNDDLPEYMHKLQAVTNEEDELIAEMKLNEFCCIVKRPAGIDFGLGVEILQRPPGHCLPPGMTLLSKDSYPDGLILPEELELVQLTPRFDLPHGCRINADWKVWPRPDGMRVPPGVQIVFPDSTSAVPTLPAGVCPTYMPDIPYGVSLPPNSQAVEIFGSAAGKSALPEGAILTPGITVLNSDELIPSPGSKNYVQGSHARALNVLLVHRMPGTPLPPLVERGSKSDLPVGTLLEENMDIVRVAVRFELPPGVRIQAGAKLGPFTQIAPGTDLVTLSGGKPDEDYSCTIRVLEWPHGVSLTPGTEFVRRPPAGYYLPVGYKEVVPPKVDVGHATAQGSWIFPQIPEYGMLVELPRAVHYATAQNLAEQVTVGLESTLEDKIVTLPLGMVLAARTSKQCQWPAEMTLAPKSSLGANLVRVIDKINVENNLVIPEPGGTTHTSSSGTGKQPSAPRTLHVEVVKLRPNYSLPPGCELLPGVVVQRKPFWLHVPSGVELISKHADSTGRLLPFTCKGVCRVQLRPDFILTGSELDSISDASGQLLPAASSPDLNRSHSTLASPGDSHTAVGRVSKDWELVDLEHTIKLSPMSLPAHYELVHVSELLDSVQSWGPYLKGVESVSRNTCEEGKPLMLPPLHFLIQRPRTLTVEPLPEGFQLGIARDYAAWQPPSLPPNVEIMHLVPTYNLPMGINIMNTSVLNKSQFNTLQTKTAAQESNVPQLQSGERISAGFSVIAKPFGSIALQKILTFDPFYTEEAHAFVRVHDPRHFQLPKMMTLDKHSNKVVESVFGTELPPDWRKGYRSKHDDILAGVQHTHQQNKLGTVTGDLYITDIIKFVRLPHGFPAPRERQKRAQARFALLKPAAHKVANAIKLLAHKKEGVAQEVDASRLDTPLTHTHTHHQKHEHSGDLQVYPRLLCIHKRDASQGGEARDKFFINVLLHRLMKPELKSHVAATAETIKIPAGLKSESTKTTAPDSPTKGLSPLIAPTDAVLFDESLHLLQDLLETTYADNTSNKELVVKLTAETAAANAALKEATDKNTTYEAQLSYDEDLKVLIHRLNLKLKSRTAEIDEVTSNSTEVVDRLKAQVELLNSQIAYYQDMTESIGANKSFSDPSMSPKHGTSSAGGSSANLSAMGDAANNALSLEHLEKFSSNLHQKYREQMLSGLDRLSELYASSIQKILEDFDNVLTNWPNWSPRDAMLAAVAWSRNRPYVPAAGTTTSPVKGLTILTGAAEDAASVLSYGLTPPKVSLGIKVREPMSMPNVTFEDEEISVLSDGESSLIGGNIMGGLTSNASLAGSHAGSNSSSQGDLSLSGYQPRDLTKDEFGRPVPLTAGFPLNVKGLYTPLAQDPNIDIVPLSTTISVGGSSGNSVTSHRSTKKLANKVPSGHDLKLLQKSLQLPAPAVTAQDALIERLELNHSLNDLFAKQRRATTPAKEKEKMIGKLPKLIHTTTAIPTAKQEETETMALNIQFFDPAVLGTGVTPVYAQGPHSQHMAGPLGTVIGNEDAMTVSADITAQQVADFLKSDSHRVEIKQKLEQSTGSIVHSVRKEFAALLTGVHSAVVSSIPKVIEQYKKDTGNETGRGITSFDIIIDDYVKVNNTSLSALQSSLEKLVGDSGHYMKYALGTVLLHSDVALQQSDVEGDILRHRLLVVNKRAELLEYLLQEARRKGTEDNQHAAADALKEKVLSLESRIERLLGLHVDPAVSVLATLVKRLQDLSDHEKQLKFSALLFKQKSAQVEARLQANRDFEYNHSHKAGNYHHLSDSEGEDDDSIGFSTKSLTVDSHGVSPMPRPSKKAIPTFHLLDKKEIKALKHFAHNVRMKARHCHARAHVLRQDCDELMACIMEHMEAYQRAAQMLLPAHLLEQVLRASTRKYQDVSAGMKLSRVRAAQAHEPAQTPKARDRNKDKGQSLADDEGSVRERCDSDVVSLTGSEGPGSVLSGNSAMSMSLSQSVVSGKSGLKALKPLRNPAESSVMAQRILVDASRTLTQANVKFGAAGSMPVAPAQSHLLLRGTGKRVTPNFNK